MKLKSLITTFIVFSLYMFCFANCNRVFANDIFKLEKVLDSCIIENRYFEGIPELGIMATSSSLVKFQRIFIDPEKGKIFKVGKKGSGPDEFQGFPNVFSDGNLLYAHDIGGKKIVVYNPATNYKIVDIISTKSLPFARPRIIGKYNDTWVLLTLQRFKHAYSKPKISYKLKVWLSKDLKTAEQEFTISDSTKDFRKNSLQMANMFFRGISVVNVAQKGYIVVNKWLEKGKDSSKMFIYCLNDKTKQTFTFKFPDNVITDKIHSGSFLGLDFKYYYIVYGKGKNDEIKSIVSSIDLRTFESKQFTCNADKETIFGSLGDKLIVQDIVSDDINLKIVDTGRLLSMKLQ